MSNLLFNARHGISVGVGQVELSDNLGNITPTSISTAGQVTSTVTTGTAPFVITSTTPVDNLSIGGNAASATDIRVDITSADVNYYVTFTSNTTGYCTAQTSSGLMFNPSTNALTASSFIGAVTGTATVAENIANGTVSSIPYQTSANTTSFIPVGSNGYVLTMVSGIPTWSIPPAGSVTSFNTRIGDIVLSSNDVITALNYNPVNKAGDTLNGNISMNSYNINNIVMSGSPAAGDVATVGYVNSVATGLVWQTAILGENLVSDTGSAPGSPQNSDIYIIGTGHNTGAWSSYLVGDVVQWQGSSWVKIHTGTVGDRYGVVFTTTTAAGGSFASNINDIITISGGTAGAWTYTTTAPVNSWATTNNNSLAINYGDSFTYSTAQTKWIQFSSNVTVTAGTGLYYSPSTTLNIQYGAGLAAIPTGDIGINVWAGGGLMTTLDGTTPSMSPGTQLSLSKVGVVGTYTNVTTDAYGRVVAGTNSTPTLVSNLAGGSAGYIPYQSSTNVTTFTSAGTPGQLLTSGGTGAPTWTSSPILVAPTLGTPLAGVLTNCVGLPVSGMSGYGTGVATALAANVIGNGSIVLSTNPTLTTPNLGTPSAVVLTNATGTAASLTAGTVTTNANLTGPITSSGNTTSVASQTGTGSRFVMDTSPTLVTPNLGTPSAVVLTNATGTAASLTAGAATNIAGGTADAIPYQTGAGATSFISAGTNGYVLTMVSGVPAWASATGGVTSFNTRTGAVTLTNGDITALLTASDITTALGSTAVTNATNATNATNSTNATITAVSTNATYYPAFVGATSGNNGIEVSTGLTFNPNTNILSAVNFVEAFATTVTAASTSTLTVGSAAIQEFTGTSTQIVVLPVVSTLVLGQTFTVINRSTGNITVNSSGANLVQTLTTTTSATFICVSVTGTTAASWDVIYDVNTSSTQIQLNYLNATTGTTGTTSSNLVFSNSPTLVTPALGTPSAVVLTNATGTAASLTAGTATTANGLTSATTTVSVSAATAPTNGQVLTATSGTTATWQTPTGTTPTWSVINTGTTATAGSNYFADTSNTTTAATSTASTISGTTLTLGGTIAGTFAIGQYLTGTGVDTATYIVSGSGTSWVVSIPQTVASTAISTTGSFNVVLPAGSANSTIQIADYKGFFGTNYLYLVPNGTDPINGSNSTFTVNVAWANMMLVFVDSTVGWRVLQ